MTTPKRDKILLLGYEGSQSIDEVVAKLRALGFEVAVAGAEKVDGPQAIQAPVPVDIGCSDCDMREPGCEGDCGAALDLPPGTAPAQPAAVELGKEKP